MNHRILAGITYIVFTLASPAAHSLPITVTGNNVIVDAFGDVGGSTDIWNGTAIPSTRTMSATASYSTNTTNINYSGDATSVVLVYEVTHGIDNTIGNLAGSDGVETKNDTFDFTADIDTTYLISGFYNMAGPAGSTVIYSVSLLDVTTSTYLFRDFAWTTNTANEYLQAGLPGGGDHQNLENGSLFGVITMGHDYEFKVLAQLGAYDAAYNATQVAATAYGTTILKIGIVPIPASAWLFGSGLLALSRRARHKIAGRKLMGSDSIDLAIH